MNWSEYKSKLVSKRKGLDLVRIEKAFLFAKDRHEGQKRKSSDEPYVVHPIHISLMLASYSEDVIVAALLHDLVEDTATTFDEIEQMFGSRVKTFVAGVSKPKGNFASKEERDIKAWEILEKAARKEPDILLIKIADRIHNLKTINILTPKRQVFKGKETLEHYLPLAKELGVGKEFWVELEEGAKKALGAFSVISFGMD